MVFLYHGRQKSAYHGWPCAANLLYTSPRLAVAEYPASSGAKVIKLSLARVLLRGKLWWRASTLELGFDTGSGSSVRKRKLTASSLGFISRDPKIGRPGGDESLS